MSAPTAPHSIGELLRRLGDIPADRVRFTPPPGTATTLDVASHRMCELIDGTLVEKSMGWNESLLAAAMIEFLRTFVKKRFLGVVTGPDSTQEISAGLVRIPDVSFFSWDRLPGRRLPTEAVPEVVPDLAIEILSKGNTPKEMTRKRNEYFDAGVRVVWMINPVDRTVEVFLPSGPPTLLHESDRLSCEEILPGFAIELRDLFAELDEAG